MATRIGRVTLREGLIVLLVLSVAPAVILGRMWKAAVDRNSQPQSAEPFRIAGNFYYVGTGDTSAFLITGPEGHVVLDAGDRAAPLIIASIAKLGFAIEDVKLLINSEPHSAGGLAALQQASGAQVWASEANARIIASGGNDPDFALPLRTAARLGIYAYPSARVDHWFDDGETIRLGPIALTAHITAGASRGSTSFSFQVRDGDRVLNVVSASSLIRVFGMRYPQQEADLKRSFAVLRSLPADIWVTGRSRQWGRYRKLVASGAAKNPVDAFIDPEGYRAYIDAAEAELRDGDAH
jgi:metallo-beta-lactamase class B